MCGGVTRYLLKRGDGLSMVAVGEGGIYQEGEVWVYMVHGWLSPRMRFQRLGGR